MEINKLEHNRLYKAAFAAIAVDVVGFKKMTNHTKSTTFNVIMNEFIYGVVKVMKEFLTPSKIQIQGDGVYAIYGTNDEKDISAVFKTACSINALQKNIDKRISDVFKNDVKKEEYDNYYRSSFKFGIGVSYSTDNLISKVGEGNDTDLIFMGHALNYANVLSKNASRKHFKNIMLDENIFKNLDLEIKNIILNIGGVTKIEDESIEGDEKVYECNLVMSDYEEFLGDI